jgi:hypothetical protein
VASVAVPTFLLPVGVVVLLRFPIGHMEALTTTISNAATDIERHFAGESVESLSFFKFS